MKQLTFFIILCLSVGKFFAQDTYGVKVLPSKLTLSYESVNRDGEFIGDTNDVDSDIGFLGIGVNVFNVIPEYKPIYFGINSYSAVKGNYPGLITLGVTTGFKFNLIQNSWNLDTGVFIGAGGGGGARDGGGLIMRPHLTLQKEFDLFSLNLGVSRIDFLSGSVRGNQITFGLSYNFNSFLKPNNVHHEFSKVLTPSQLFLKKIQFALAATGYFNMTNNSIRSASGVNNELASSNGVGLIGAQIGLFFNQNIYGVFKINGAMVGDADGYMSILLGAGYEKPIVKETLSLNFQAVAGPSGGGYVETGGGFISQLETGVTCNITQNLYVKLLAGKSFAPWGAFNSNHLECSLGTSLYRMNPKLDPSNMDYKINNSGLFVNSLKVGIFNRTYFSPDSNDVWGRPYNDFNLLGFYIKKNLKNNLYLNFATIWAYQGGYGSYAEGLLGLGYANELISGFGYDISCLFGAAGGAAIQLGNGLTVQSKLGVYKNINDVFRITTSYGKFIRMSSGNFNPTFLDIGVDFKLEQLFYKKAIKD